MGVPPVDRVMLMCYNLLNPLTNTDKNTILDMEELKGYFTGRSQYPLACDVALPVYGRMQLYKNGHFAGVIRADEEEILPLLRNIKPMWYELSADTVLGDTYLRRGDLIKYEEVPPAQLAELSNFLSQQLTLADTTTIALFHLDNYALKHYPHESLEAAYNAFTP